MINRRVNNPYVCNLALMWLPKITYTPSTARRSRSGSTSARREAAVDQVTRHHDQTGAKALACSTAARARKREKDG